jgi:excisionase family DNA binding protein
MSSQRTPQAPHLSSRLAPVKAESRRTGIPYTSLRDIIHRGEIPIIRIGRAQYVEKTDIDHWIETRKERA